MKSRSSKDRGKDGMRSGPGLSQERSLILASADGSLLDGDTEHVPPKSDPAPDDGTWLGVPDRLSADDIVWPDEVERLLHKPIPILLVAAEGTVLAANALAAWLCGSTRAIDLLLQNVYSLSADAVTDGRIPISCNSRFAFRKLKALRELDFDNTWPAHSKLREALSLAKATQRSRICPIRSCGQITANESEWRYPLCIWRPDRWPTTSDQEDLLQFEVVDSPVWRSNVESDIPAGEKRFVVAFHPSTPETSEALDEVRHFLTEAGEYRDTVVPDKLTIDYVMNNDIESASEVLKVVKQENANQLRKGSFGELVRALRTRRGLSPERFSRRIGVSRGAVSHWETGRRLPQDTHLVQRIIEVLAPSSGEQQQMLTALGITEIGGFAPKERLDFLELTRRRIARIEQLQSQILEFQDELAREVAGLRKAVDQELFWPFPDTSETDSDAAEQVRDPFKRRSSVLKNDKSSGVSTRTA